MCAFLLISPPPGTDQINILRRQRTRYLKPWCTAVLMLRLCTVLRRPCSLLVYTWTCLLPAASSCTLSVALEATTDERVGVGLYNKRHVPAHFPRSRLGFRPRRFSSSRAFGYSRFPLKVERSQLWSTTSLVVGKDAGCSAFFSASCDKELGVVASSHLRRS